MAARLSTAAGSPKLLFRQLFEKESSTYTYLLADVGHPEKPALVRFRPLFNVNSNLFVGLRIYGLEHFTASD